MLGKPYNTQLKNDGWMAVEEMWKFCSVLSLGELWESSSTKKKNVNIVISEYNWI